MSSTTSTDLAYYILKIFVENTDTVSDDPVMSLEEILSSLETLLKTSFKGPKYSKFKETLDWLVEKKFLKQRKEGPAKFFQLLDAGKEYYLHGRYLEIPKYLNFVVNPLFTSVIFLVHIWPFIVFAAIYHRLTYYFIYPGFFILLEFMLLLPILGKYYLNPLLIEVLGIDLDKSSVDLFNPVCNYLINNGFDFKKMMHKFILWSVIFSVVINVILSYVSILDLGLKAPGRYNIPINTSAYTMVFNLVFIPVSNFIFYLMMFLLIFLGVYLNSLPLELPNHVLMQNVDQFLDLHKRVFHVSLFALFNSLFLASIHTFPSSPYPFFSLFFLLLVIAIVITVIILFLWALGYQKLQTIKENSVSSEK